MSEQERDDAPWEPWRPRVGQRVRVRLSGECPLPLRPLGWGCWVEHYPQQDGLDGWVVGKLLWPYHARHHSYLVELPEITDPNGNSCTCGTFAAVELEPLEE